MKGRSLAKIVRSVKAGSLSVCKQNHRRRFSLLPAEEEVAVVVISDLASLSLKDAAPPNASVVTAPLLAWTTEGPEICTQRLSRIV